jgi:hypothetical protein
VLLAAAVAAAPRRVCRPARQRLPGGGAHALAVRTLSTSSSVFPDRSGFAELAAAEGGLVETALLAAPLPAL